MFQLPSIRLDGNRTHSIVGFYEMGFRDDKNVYMTGTSQWLAYNPGTSRQRLIYYSGGMVEDLPAMPLVKPMLP
jgi:hypothetical protein